MPTPEIPLMNAFPTANPQPPHPGLESRIGDVPKERGVTASKKVDDLSRHESKHDTAPKHEPKLNAREKTYDGSKPGGSSSQGPKPPMGPVKK